MLNVVYAEILDDFGVFHDRHDVRAKLDQELANIASGGATGIQGFITALGLPVVAGDVPEDVPVVHARSVSEAEPPMRARSVSEAEPRQEPD